MTIAGVKVASLACPSDLTDSVPILPPPPSGTSPGWNFGYDQYPTTQQFNQAFTSYGGCSGTFISKYYIGIKSTNPTQVLAQMNGIIYADGAVKIAAITDGTSNTFLFGERANLLLVKGRLQPFPSLTARGTRGSTMTPRFRPSILRI